MVLLCKWLFVMPANFCPTCSQNELRAVHNSYHNFKQPVPLPWECCRDGSPSYRDSLTGRECKGLIVARILYGLSGKLPKSATVPLAVTGKRPRVGPRLTLNHRPVHTFKMVLPVVELSLLYEYSQLFVVSQVYLQVILWLVIG